MFETHLDYRYDPETKRHILLQDLVYVTKDGERIVVPKGFTTDRDSVPRIPFVHAIAKERAVLSAVMHDYLYYKQYDRKKCDDIFFEAMIEEKVPAAYRQMIYCGVRSFGWVAYNSKKERKRWDN